MRDSTPEPEEASFLQVRRWLLERLSRIFLVAAVLASFGMLFAVVLAARRAPDAAAVVAAGATPPAGRSSAPASPTRFALAVSPTSIPNLPLVALLAGHSGGTDTGAICPDGLREVDVTTDVAARAKTILEARGYGVDILAEFDPRLNASKRDYAPRAFLAIHADSCIYTASGYKVARATNSGSPQEDDRLVRCVTAAYGAATELPFHADSITVDMTRYHAFNEIDAKTPSAILELGFLGSQHDMLKNRRALLADGIANGVDDFMQGLQCKKPDGSNQ